MKRVAVVLAAGRSRRMGVPKATLQLGGEALLRHVVGAALAGGCAAVRVCVAEQPGGARLDADAARALLGAVRSSRVELFAGASQASPIDSLRRALVDWPAAAALLLWPVDAPFGTAALVHALGAALAEHGDRIVVPVTSGRRGHPVLFGSGIVAELLSPYADGGARAVVRRVSARVIEVGWDDPRIACRLNTPDDAAALGIAVPTPSG